MGKPKRPQKNIVELHKSGFSQGAISQLRIVAFMSKPYEHTDGINERDEETLV